jgi:NAD(P)-dependent dehydrogenase (short-subunit alcohol dehydrogenase family)
MGEDARRGDVKAKVNCGGVAMKDFKGKVVYVAGGSSGIGLAIAKLFAAEGAHVTIFARRKDVLERAAKEITSQRVSDGQRFSCKQLDVSARKQVESVMSESVAEFGAPDVLINCAGRARPHYFQDITYEQFDETMKINLYGTWNTISVLLPHMKKRGGYIVNVSSIAGFVGVFGYTDYSASKFGLIGLSEVLRSELKGYGIVVSVLCPPDTDTPGFEEENRTKPPECQAISAHAKLIQPQEVARALIKGMHKGQFLIVPNFDGKFTLVMKRLFPGLVEFVMDEDIEKCRRTT